MNETALLWLERTEVMAIQMLAFVLTLPYDVEELNTFECRTVRHRVMLFVDCWRCVPEYLSPAIHKGLSIDVTRVLQTHEVPQWVAGRQSVVDRYDLVRCVANYEHAPAVSSP